MKTIIIAVMLMTSCVFANTDKIINDAIERFMKEKNVSGVAVAFFDGQNEHFYNFGFANVAANQSVTSDTIFEIASITKVFTSTELALEVQRGRMNLQDSIAKYLTTLQGPYPVEHIKLVNLATHTSSLERVPPERKNGWNENQILDYLRKWRPDHAVGTNYLYSNLAFGILGYAEASREGMDYIDLIRRDILNPLGMSSTMINVPGQLHSRYALGYDRNNRSVPQYPENAWPAGGALRSTASDMMKFLKANLNVSGPADLRQAMQFAQQGIYKVNNQLTMGLGWQRFQFKGLLYIDKNGGVPGFSSYIGMLPDRKIGIVLLANKPKSQITDVGREILRKIAKKEE